MEGLNLQDILECDLLRASGEDRSALLKWFLARDVFTGRNFKAQDFERGLALASKSSLPEARLFCRTLRRFEAPFSRKQLRKLLEQQADDPIALCLLGLVFCDPHLLQQAVDRGSVLAHAALSAVVLPARKFQLALHAARHGDPQGLFVLGFCFEVGVSCIKSLSLAGQCYREAARCNWVEAQHRLALVAHRPGDVARLRWLAVSARGAHVGGEQLARAFLDEMSLSTAAVAGDFVPNAEDGELLQQVAALLKGRVHGRSVFGIDASNEELQLVHRLLSIDAAKENHGRHDRELESLRAELVDAKREIKRLGRELEAAQRRAEQCETTRLMDDLRAQIKFEKLSKELEEARQAQMALSNHLSVLRDAGIAMLREQQRGHEPILRNCMMYVHLNQRGQWTTRSWPLPKACLDLLEEFELPADHPAASSFWDVNAHGVRVRLDAPRGLKSGEIVMFYAGHVRCGLETDPSDYPFVLRANSNSSTDPVVDALHLGNLARFLNDPRGTGVASNCFPEFQDVPHGEQHMVCVALRAVRDIQQGEELTIDYGEAYWQQKERRDASQYGALTAFRKACEVYLSSAVPNGVQSAASSHSPSQNHSNQ